MTDLERIAPAGEPITLADGRVVTLHYTMRSLAILEEHFGSLQAIGEQMSGEGKVVGPMCHLLAAGLLHENMTSDDVMDQVSPKLLSVYVQAASTAFARAMPENPSPEAVAPESVSPNGSHGAISTTSQLSVSGAPTPPSGP